MYDQVAANKHRSWLLVGGFGLLVALVVAIVALLLGGGWIGVVVAVVIAAATSFAAYWRSDAVALRMSRAVPAPVEQYARYHNIVEGLCIASGLPKPRLYVIDDPAPNAFATGRNPRTAAVAVTSGAVANLTTANTTDNRDWSHELQLFAHHYSDHRDVTTRPDNTGLSPQAADVDIATFGASHLGSYAIGSSRADSVLWVAGQFGDWYGIPHHAVSVIAVQWLLLHREELRRRWAKHA